ncbi:MAG: response regulator transcription factor [Myxococcota bacterium]
MATRIVIVEDNPWIRQSAEEMLTSAGVGFEVVASFDAVAPAVTALAGGLVAEAALVDLGLPDGSGVDVIRAFRQLCPAAVVVAFTVLDDPKTIFDALRAGARGYLLKSTAPARLVPLLQDALAGGAPMSAPVARLVVDSFRGAVAPTDATSASDAESLTRLTPREREVLVLLAKGLSYPEVARVLGVGLGTVQGYVKSVYSKLEVASKAEAAIVAARLGLV